MFTLLSLHSALNLMKRQCQSILLFTNVKTITVLVCIIDLLNQLCEQADSSLTVYWFLSLCVCVCLCLSVCIFVCFCLSVFLYPFHCLCPYLSISPPFLSPSLFLSLPLSFSLSLSFFFQSQSEKAKADNTYTLSKLLSSKISNILLTRYVHMFSLMR